jgi:hypothetical protein
MHRDPLLATSTKPRFVNKNKSRPWIRGVLVGTTASICCLIVLIILLAIPITVLVIGTRYRDPRYCPIEPRISLFLIVHGSILIGWITFTILTIIMAIIFAAGHSTISIALVVILSVLNFLILIFSIVWLIIGSVWTFSVYNRVIYEYDTINHFYLYTYCQPLLYKFTFVYLIVSWVLMAIQCCLQSFTAIFGPRQET